MDITVVRLHDDGAATIGKLFIDTTFECFTLEDTFREKKIPGKTRIPSGRYEVTLRTFGGHHEKYKVHNDRRISLMHHGMLWVRDVPQFTDILHHIGNYHWNTEGCLLVGRKKGKDQHGNFCVFDSTEAYIEYYRKVVNDFKRGHRVFINYLDADKI